MNKQSKALLLSALVFPGAGHLYLKKYLSGLLLAGTSLVIIGYLVNTIMETAYAIADKIQSGSAQLDIMNISGLILQETGTAGLELQNRLSLLLLACWIIGIADSYRVARKQAKIE